MRDKRRLFELEEENIKLLAEIKVLKEEIERLK